MKLPAALALAVLLAGCARTPVMVAPPPPSPSPSVSRFQLAPATMAWYRDHARNATVLRIDPAQSVIVVTVRRGGALARLGHDHVVASHAIEGLAAPDGGRADFGFRLDQLIVDEAPLRAQAQLDTQPSPDAIAGTRVNMLTRVLEAERFPEVTLAVTGQLAASDGSAILSAAITLHGVTRSVPTTVQVTRSAGALTASGTMSLRQSDFGITPMSVFNGAMTVLDTMELRYTIVARPAQF